MRSNEMLLLLLLRKEKEEEHKHQREMMGCQIAQHVEMTERQMARQNEMIKLLKQSRT